MTDTPISDTIASNDSLPRTMQCLEEVRAALVKGWPVARCVDEHDLAWLVRTIDELVAENAGLKEDLEAAEAEATDSFETAERVMTERDRLAQELAELRAKLATR